LLAALALWSVVYLQSSLLWHDVAHAGHDHGESILCEISPVVPDHGGVIAAVQSIVVTGESARAVSVGVDSLFVCQISAYHPRAPPLLQF